MSHDDNSTCTFTTEKSVTFTGACANEIIPSINRSFVYKAKEGRHVRIGNSSGCGPFSLTGEVSISTSHANLLTNHMELLFK
jgi:hypothetical protein